MIQGITSDMPRAKSVRRKRSHSRKPKRRSSYTRRYRSASDEDFIQRHVEESKEELLARNLAKLMEGTEPRDDLAKFVETEVRRLGLSNKPFEKMSSSEQAILEYHFGTTDETQVKNNWQNYLEWNRLLSDDAQNGAIGPEHIHQADPSWNNIAPGMQEYLKSIGITEQLWTHHGGLIRSATDLAMRRHNFNAWEKRHLLVDLIKWIYPKEQREKVRGELRDELLESRT